MTSDSSLGNCPNSDIFKSMNFESFLLETGICVGLESGRKYFESATKRYITALRSGVKSSGILLLKRSPCDVFTNKYNNKLTNFHKANQDIQYVSDMRACAQYVTNQN